jgi:hypothetical protein
MCLHLPLIDALSVCAGYCVYDLCVGRRMHMCVQTEAACARDDLCNGSCVVACCQVC